MSHPNTLAERRICALKHSGNDWHASHKGAHSHKYSKGCASNDLQWNSPRWRYADKAERMYHVSMDHSSFLLNAWRESNVQSLTQDEWEYYTFEGDWRRLDVNNMEGRFCSYCQQFHEPDFWNVLNLNWSEEEYLDDPYSWMEWHRDFSRCPVAAHRTQERMVWVAYMDYADMQYRVCRMSEFSTSGHGSFGHAFSNVVDAARWVCTQNNLMPEYV